MYLYRSLNNDDRVFDSEKYGLYSKLMFNQINKTLNELEEDFNQCEEEERNGYINKFLNDVSNIELGANKVLINEFYSCMEANDFNGKKCAKAIQIGYNDFLFDVYHDVYNQLIDRESNWISTSWNINVGANRFSKETDDFKVAVITCNEDEFMNMGRSLTHYPNFTSNNVVLLDLSLGQDTYENRLGLFLNDNGEYSERTMKYAKYDEEVLAYNHIPSERVVFIHNQLSYDLVRSGILDEEVLYSLEDKYGFIECIKNHIKRIVEEEPKFNKYRELVETQYIKNIPAARIIDKELEEEAKKENLIGIEKNDFKSKMSSKYIEKENIKKENMFVDIGIKEIIYEEIKNRKIVKSYS